MGRVFFRRCHLEEYDIHDGIIKGVKYMAGERAIQEEV